VVGRRVARCAERQLERQGCRNAELQLPQLLEVCALGAQEKSLLAAAAERMQLSARAVHRSLRTARTIADLAGEARVQAASLSEALAYRGDERDAP
jgi:magnesium chelatase family protein